jgi:S-adenosylmethionine decarboxylase
LELPGYSSAVPNTSAPPLGEEWIVDAAGCDPERLRDLEGVRALLEEIVRTLALHVVTSPLWHKFDGEGGVTGLYLLGESHLACHTYPEHGSATLNLYSCRPKAPLDWDALLARTLGGSRVRVTRVLRGGAA